MWLSTFIVSTTTTQIPLSYTNKRQFMLLSSATYMKINSIDYLKRN